MAKNIGTLGTVHAAIDLEFDYFGKTFHVHPDASDLELIQFMIDASDVDESDQVKAMHALGRFLKRLVHPDEFTDFWETAKANRQGMGDVMTAARAIMAAVTEFPTGQPTGSSGGLLSTGQKSGDASSLQDRRTRSTAAMVEHYRGRRPDLQVMALNAEEDRNMARSG